jgi:hypothetical protein
MLFVISLLFTFSFYISWPFTVPTVDHMNMNKSISISVSIYLLRVHKYEYRHFIIFS